MEAAYMSIYRGLGKDVVHIYNGILFSLYKEWSSVICSNLDGPRDYGKSLLKVPISLGNTKQFKIMFIYVCVCMYVYVCIHSRIR